jgi:hypothetical protein
MKKSFKEASYCLFGPCLRNFTKKEKKYYEYPFKVLRARGHKVCVAKSNTNLKSTPLIHP